MCHIEAVYIFIVEILLILIIGIWVRICGDSSILFCVHWKIFQLHTSVVYTHSLYTYVYKRLKYPNWDAKIIFKMSVIDIKMF